MWWIPKLLLIATKMFFARNYTITNFLLFKMKYVMDEDCSFDY